MRLDNTAHTDAPWRIHELAPDFVLADVWELPTPGGPDDLARLAQVIASGDEEFMSHPAVKALFAIRLRVGSLLGMDSDKHAVGAGWTLRERLPTDLRDGPRGPDITAVLPFPSVYLTDSEWVAEGASRSVHLLQHVGWVADGSGGFRGQMAVLVRPNGRWGRMYMQAIMPFRRTIVVPALVRSIVRDWEKRMRPDSELGLSK